MPPTYIQRYQFITENELFLTTVMMAAVDAAIDINAESPSGDADLDTARIALSRNMLQHPNRFSRLLAHGVVVHDDAKVDMTDSEIYDIVVDIWNAYAGTKAAA
jgi:hypothetical protein